MCPCCYVLVGFDTGKGDHSLTTASFRGEELPATTGGVVSPESAESSIVKSIETRVALRLRAAWMRAMSVPEDEINETCDPTSNSADLEEEIENLLSIEKIKNLNNAIKQTKAALASRE